jgi:hypothetical protein
MSLLEIKNYLKEAKIVSLSTLCTYFNCDSDLVRAMLGHLVRKGCVRGFSKTANCGTKCQKCLPGTTEIYEWVYN